MNPDNLSDFCESYYSTLPFNQFSAATMSELFKRIVSDISWESLEEDGLSRADSTESVNSLAFYPALSWELNNIR